MKKETKYTKVLRPRQFLKKYNVTCDLKSNQLDFFDAIYFKSQPFDLMKQKLNVCENVPYLNFSFYKILI